MWMTHGRLNKVKSLEPRVCGSYTAKSEVKHLAAGDYDSNNVDQYQGSVTAILWQSINYQILG